MEVFFNKTTTSIPLLLLLLSFLSVSFIPSAKAVSFNIIEFGARPDGLTDSTRPILSTWSAACGSAGPSTIYVPVGRFMVGRAVFGGPCRSPSVTIQMEGTLIAPSNYTLFQEDWMLFDHVNGLSIFGGTIDGQGAALWACKAQGRTCPEGPASLVIAHSRSIMISGLTSINPKLYHIVINTCQEVTIQGVRITAPANSRNTDGIHVQLSYSVNVVGTNIGTGDDCISVGPGTSNLWIDRVTCGPGHGISIGSLGKELQEEGVENITVTTSTFIGTENGVRIKTWGRQSTSFVRGVVFEHLIMQNARNPIIINQNYCEEERICPDQNSGVKISQVTYSDIQGSSGTPVAMDFDCSPSNPCIGLILENIRLVFPGVPAQSSCKRAYGVASGPVFPPSCLNSSTFVDEHMKIYSLACSSISRDIHEKKL